MPILRRNRHKYPKDWNRIRARIIDRAAGKCECDGRCGDHDGMCPERQGMKAIRFGGTVSLQIAHQNQNELDCSDENLKAFCAKCHLSFDRSRHVENRRETMDRKRMDDGWSDEGWED